MQELTNVLVSSSVRYLRMELMLLISMYAVLHVLMMCCFIEKFAIKNEAKVADGSRKLNIGIAEKDCLWVWQGRVDRG